MADVDLVAGWDGLYWSGAEPPFLDALLVAVGVDQETATLSINAGVIGSLKWSIQLSTDTAPSISDILAGTNALDFGAETVSTPGAVVISATGLTADTSYIGYAVLFDADERPGPSTGQDSVYIVASDTFTTTAIGGGPAVEASIVFHAGFDSLATGALVNGTTYTVADGRVTGSTSGKGDISIVTTPTPYAGGKAFKAFLDDALEYRSELQLSGYPTFNATYPATPEGEELWIGFACYIATDYAFGPLGTSGMIVQWHTGPQPVAIDNPAWRIELENDGAISIYRRGQTFSNVKYACTGVTFDDIKGTFARFVVQFKYSKTNTGTVRLWINDTLVSPATLLNVQTWDASYTAYGHIKIGLYNGEAYSAATAAGTRTAYYDSIRIAEASSGGNYATVDPATYI
jgi:hypothetical protein